MPVGGISNVILELLPVYEKNKNIKISLITKYSEYVPISERAKINIIYKFLISKVNTLYFFFRSFFRIVRINKKAPIHVINVHSFYYDIITPFFVRLIFKIPLLLKPPSDFITQQREIFMSNPHSIFSSMAYYGWMKFFKKFVIKRKNVYFQAINDKIFCDLLDLNVSEKNIIKLPNGISIEKYLGQKKHSNAETHFGYIGRLIKSKNIEFILNVFREYLSKFPQDKLYIFGKGSEKRNISNYIIKNNLSKNIILWGFEKNKSKMYFNIDVLIHPSYGEGCPNTILESILTDTFVIASNVVGIRDIIDHKSSGLLFNPFKEDDLLKQLLFYKKNQDIVPKIKENAKIKIVNNYDVNFVANSIYNFLKTKLTIKIRQKLLKIAIITPVFPYPNRGVFPGIERYVESIAIPLKKLGNEVKIITTFWNGGNRHDVYEGIPILRIMDSKEILGKLGSIFHLNNISFGLNLIRKHNFKFFQDSDIIIMPLAIGFTSFFKVKKMLVISGFLHYDYINSLMEYLTIPFYHYLEKRQFKKHKYVITISNSSKEDIIEHYKIKDENIKVFPIGIDSYEFNPSNYSSKIREKYGKNILLYVGPFIHRKRIPVLLKAMTRVIKEIPDAHLILIGKGILWNFCKNLSNYFGLQKSTTFLGFIDDKELLQYYASSDIYILPSEHEGFGQVILEAMASGTPVICANKPPMSEIVGNGGRKYKLNDPVDLSRKIIELLRDRKELERLRENALKIAQNYDLLIIAETYISYFNEIRKKF